MSQEIIADNNQEIADEHRNSALRTRAVAALATIGALAFGGSADRAEAKAGDRVLPVPETRLFDVGLIDYNQDGYTDIQTSAHSFPNAMLENKADGISFDDVTYESGFHVTPEYPGLEEMDREPNFDEPGLYIYQKRDNRKTKDTYQVLRAYGVQVSGNIKLDPSRKARRMSVRGGSLNMDEREYITVDGDERPRVSKMSFDLESGGEIVLNTTIQIPATFSVNEKVNVFVGVEAVPAKDSKNVVAETGDLHGSVTLDIDDDGDEDLFRLLGGVGGKVTLPGMSEIVSDQAYLYENGMYVPTELGLKKDGCRGRDVSTVDADGNGEADIFSSCEGDVPRINFQKNDSWKIDRIPAPGEVYRWLQLGKQAKPKLLALGERATIFAYGKSGWERLQTVKLYGHAEHVAIDDFDRDGAVDAFVSSRKGNTLLTSNKSGKIKSSDPTIIGLPNKGSVAAWADYNLDGRADLHQLQNGVFTQTKSDNFKKTGKLKVDTGYGHLMWGDFNNNGTIEPLMGRSPNELAPRGRIMMRNGVKQGWLWLDFPGAANGSRIEVRTPRSKKPIVAWAGQNNTSRHSDTDHRVYITGLKQAQQARVNVTYPDGTKQSLKVDTNQVIDVPEK